MRCLSEWMRMELPAMHTRGERIPKGNRSREMWMAVIPGTAFTTMARAIQCMCLRLPLICCLLFRCTRRTGRATVMCPSAVCQNTRCFNCWLIIHRCRKSFCAWTTTKAGLKARERLAGILTEKGYGDVFSLLPQRKDWNEDLQAVRQELMAEVHSSLAAAILQG